MKTWEVNYGAHVVTVENRASGERLYVNGELQDEQLGINVGSRLCGQLPTGEDVKVSIGGVWKIHCRIFIDNKMIFPKK